ncbi:MAG: FAD-dependent oxidoreductase, partial [Candidatus Brocadiia bacterium]
MTEEHPIVIAGAGIAGLSAACRLQGASELPFVVLERDEQLGGHSRTLQWNGFRFDLGGHRFYTRKAPIERFVRDLVGDDLLTVDRVSHIRFRGSFVDYPLRPLSTLAALGPVGATRAVLDYATMKLKRLADGHEVENTFEQWALNRFGQYLYQVYFKVYTEKTWGVACSELSADFAEQRIKGLSFREAVRDAVLKTGEDESLVRRFLYPRFGFGQIPGAMAQKVRPPNRILRRRRVQAIEHREGRVTAVRTAMPS